MLPQFERLSWDAIREMMRRRASTWTVRHRRSAPTNGLI